MQINILFIDNFFIFIQNYQLFKRFEGHMPKIESTKIKLIIWN
jgi:hypothetical protein